MSVIQVNVAGTADVSLTLILVDMCYRNEFPVEQSIITRNRDREIIHVAALAVIISIRFEF
jgi:hypothetical protein